MGEFAVTRKVMLGTSLLTGLDNKLKVAADVTGTMGLMHKSAPFGEVDKGENYIGGEVGAKGSLGDNFASVGLFGGFGTKAVRRLKWHTSDDGVHLGGTFSAGYSVRYFNSENKGFVGHGPYVSTGFYWGPDHKGYGLPLFGIGGRVDFNLPNINLTQFSIGVEGVF